MYSTMALDLVGFLPTTDSEVIAKRNNHQHEKRLLCQLRGIERQEKFSRAIINKSNTVLKQHIMLKRNKPETSSAGYSSAPMPRLPSNYQGLYTIECFHSLKRKDEYTRHEIRICCNNTSLFLIWFFILLQDVYGLQKTAQETCLSVSTVEHLKMIVYTSNRILKRPRVMRRYLHQNIGIFHELTAQTAPVVVEEVLKIIVTKQS